MSELTYLENIPFLNKSLSGKFLLIAFIGIHIPLIGLSVFIYHLSGTGLSVLQVILITLVFTLIATAITLPMLHKLLKPLLEARKALLTYKEKGMIVPIAEIPNDETGQLLRQIMDTITSIDRQLDSKTNMIDLVSHDFRAPLNRVISLCDLLKTADPEETFIYSQLILKECNDLLRLLENILAMLKQDEKDSGLKLEPTDLKSEIWDALAAYSSVAQEKGVTLAFMAIPGYEVRADKALFTQAIKNLVANAIKFSESGKEVSISERIVGSNVLVQITDTGIGFEPEVGERLFDRFTSEARRGTNGESSTGLGLSIARNVIKRHGGNLTAHSDGPGKGATFTISLPITHFMVQ